MPQSGRRPQHQIIDRLHSGVKPTYGDGYELEQRQAILERLDSLKSALAQTRPAHGGIGHNRPPPDDDSPQALALSYGRKLGTARTGKAAYRGGVRGLHFSSEGVIRRD